MRNPSWTPIAGRYVVDDIVVDARLRKVVRPEGKAELTQRVFDLLLVFLCEPHVLHTRASLFERVWGSTCVEDANLTQSISVMRRALGEERKTWIRTLSKQGYAFEPPGSVECIAAGDDMATPAADISALRPQPINAGRPLPLRSRRMFSIIVGSVLAAALLMLPGSKNMPAPDSTAAQAAVRHAAIALVLVEAENPGATAAERWATKLLTEWLRWKLSCMPAVSLVNAEDLIAERSTSTYFMDLSVAASPVRAGRFDFAIRFRPAYAGAKTAGGNVVDAFQQTVSLSGGAERLPAMVDGVSNAALTRIFPQRALDRWPSLALDVRSAVKYTEAIEAYQRRDTAAASALLRDVVAGAPDFGPARMRLAQALAHDGRMLEAAEQANLARGLSTPLPADAAAVLAAEADAMAPGRADESVRAYARLYAAHPARVDFLLAQAQLLLRANRPEAAMRLLSRPEWKRQPPSVRILHRLAMSESAMTLGYLDQARENAAEAISLIGATDGGWARELGTAQLMYARAWHQQFRTRSKPELHSQAASTFEAQGYRRGALTARFYEALSRSDIAAAETQLRQLLAVIRGSGDRSAEIKLLRSMAEQYAEAGMREPSNRLRTQAYAVASRVGDVAARQLLDLDMLGEDLLAGRLEQAQRRIDRLRANRLWTKYRFRVSRRESDLLTLQGRHREALSVLDGKLAESARSARLDVSPVEAAKIACARMETLLTMGELSMARAQLHGCRDSGSASVPVLAALGEAGIAYHSGNLQEARRHADEAERLLMRRAMHTGHLAMGAALAGLLTRLRDYDRAERLYASLYAGAEREGYALLLAEIEVGQAEIAAVRRDWNASARYADTVRKRFPAGLWRFGSRLELLEIAQQSSAGDVFAARARATALAAQAQRLGDAVVKAQASAFAPVAIAVNSDGSHGYASLQPASLPDSGELDWLIAPDRTFAHAHRRVH